MMASTECFHFTKLKNLYSIKNEGLKCCLDGNSKLLKDKKPKISFSDGKVGVIGMFFEIQRVYTEFKTGQRFPDPDDPEQLEYYQQAIKSDSLEDFLGNGVYLLFDGTGIENEGGNCGDKDNFYDASTTKTIQPNKLRVGLVRDDDTKEVSYSMYDYIDYLMATASSEEIEILEPKMKRTMASYVNEHSEDISKFRSGNFSLQEVDIDTFCKVCKKDIDKSIAEYQAKENENKGKANDTSDLDAETR